MINFIKGYSFLFFFFSSIQIFASTGPFLQCKITMSDRKEETLTVLSRLGDTYMLSIDDNGLYFGKVGNKNIEVSIREVGNDVCLSAEAGGFVFEAISACYDPAKLRITRKHQTLNIDCIRFEAEINEEDLDKIIQEAPAEKKIYRT